MDKFEQIFKNAIEGYEAPFNPQAWEGISSQLGSELSPFEQSMKDSVDKFQAPAANPMIWDNISNQLGNELSPFEQSMKDSVNKFEAAAASGLVWESISSQLGNSAFEQTVKESVEAYEAPANPSAWEAIKSQLGNSYTWKWVTGSAALLLLLVGGYYMIPTDDNTRAEGPNNGGEQTQIADNTNETVIANDIKNDNSTANHDDANHGSSHKLNDNNILSPIDHDVDHNVVANVEEGENEFDQLSNNDGGESNNDNGDNGSNGEDVNDATNDNNVDHAAVTYVADIKCDPEVCQGDIMDFSAEQVERGCEYVWDFGDGTSAKGVNVQHIYNQDGEYDVTLTLYKENAAVVSDERAVVVNRIPIPYFTIENPNTGIPNYKFSNTSDATTAVNWEVDGMGTTKRNEFEVTFREKGDYVAKLTLTNEFGCSNTRKEIIEVDYDYNLLAQNSLVLNDVDERRSTFMPAALQILDQEFVMTIYAKDGGMVYQTRDANSPWDGRYSSDNRSANPGSAFVWIVQLKNANGEMETYKGTVTIL